MGLRLTKVAPQTPNVPPPPRPSSAPQAASPDLRGYLESGFDSTGPDRGAARLLNPTPPSPQGPDGAGSGKVRQNLQDIRRLIGAGSADQVDRFANPLPDDRRNQLDGISREDMMAINEKLKELTPRERSYVISQLSDLQLQHWADQTDKAIGGLGAGRHHELFNTLSEGMDGAQACRIYRNFTEDYQREFLNEGLNEHASAQQRLDFVRTATDQGLVARDSALAERAVHMLARPDASIGEGDRLDGAHLAQFTRAALAAAPGSEDELLRAVTSSGSDRVKVDFVKELAGGLNADPHTETMGGLLGVFNSPPALSTTYGDAPSRAAVAILASLADRTASPGGTGSAAAYNEAVDHLASSGKLEAALRLAAGRRDTTSGITTSTFDPGALTRIVDAAGRSGSPGVKDAVLKSAAKELGGVENADSTLQKVGLPRPEAARIAASIQGLLGCPRPLPSFSPGKEEQVQPDAAYSRNSLDDTMKSLANHEAELQGAAKHYNVDPRAIAVAVLVEKKFNPPSFASRPFSLPIGRGDGFGAMHDIAVRTVHPDWTDDQIQVARTDARYAPALLAADMDAKARVFEQLSGGKVSIRDNPVALAWAYNNSLETVARYANRAAEDAASGKPVLLDFSKSNELGDLGMAGHAKTELSAGAVDSYGAGGFRPHASPTPVQVKVAGA